MEYKKCTSCYQPTDYEDRRIRIGLVPTGFTPLIATLTKFKSLYNSSPFCSAVKWNLMSFQEAGCWTFMEYVRLAEHAGMVLMNETPNCISDERPSLKRINTFMFCTTSAIFICYHLGYILTIQSASELVQAPLGSLLMGRHPGRATCKSHIGTKQLERR